MRLLGFAVIAASVMVGSAAFGQPEPFIEYRCKLESSKAKGGECWVKGDLRFATRVDFIGEMKVKCTDGFRLFDEEARGRFDDGDLVVRGEDGDEEAKLVIEDVQVSARNEEDEFEATLETLEDGEERVYSGECRIDASSGDLDDDVDVRRL